MTDATRVNTAQPDELALASALGKIQPKKLRIFLFIYTFYMLAISALTLGLAPRALKDLGQERQRLRQEAPAVTFEAMVEAGYRVNFFLLLTEIFYYYLLLGFGGPGWQLFYGGFAFGVIHIGYLAASRLEKKRLSRGSTRTGAARFLIWLTAALTAVEIAFLAYVAFLLLHPQALAQRPLPSISIFIF